MEYPEPFMAVQHLCAYAHSLEIVDNIGFDTFQPGLCCLQAIGIDTKGEVFCFHQTVVASGQLVLQHLGIFVTNTVEFVTLRRDGNALCEGLLRSSQIHKGKLEFDRAVKIVQEVTPAVEDFLLIVIAGELIVDITELDCFCVMRIADTANTIRSHTQIRDAVLGGDFFLIRSFRA